MRRYDHRNDSEAEMNEAMLRYVNEDLHRAARILHRVERTLVYMDSNDDSGTLVDSAVETAKQLDALIEDVADEIGSLGVV